MSFTNQYKYSWMSGENSRKTMQSWDWEAPSPGMNKTKSRNKFRIFIKLSKFINLYAKRWIKFKTLKYKYKANRNRINPQLK